MKKFLFKLIIFFIILVICDLSMGTLFTLYDLTKRGEIHKMNILMTRETPDLLILGSSRASHHYVPQLIGDSLNIGVFNAGLDGAGTTMGYGILAGIAQRNYPRYIVCEITPSFDIYDENGSAKGLDFLYPYSSIPVVKDIITDFDITEKWKLISNSYRLNSKLVRIIPAIFSQNDDYLLGFIPLNGKINPDNNNTKNKSVTANHKIHPIKEKYLRRLIQDARANDCEIIFAISPIYGGGDISSYNEEIDIINQYNAILLNHLNDPTIINNIEYFQDATHMNNLGAQKYSEIIAEELINIGFVN